MVESKCADTKLLKLAGDSLDVSAAVAASETVHQHDERTPWSPVGWTVIMKHQDVAIGKVDSMADRRVPCCFAADEVGKQGLSMPASKQWMWIELWQIGFRQCVASGVAEFFELSLTGGQS